MQTQLYTVQNSYTELKAKRIFLLSWNNRNKITMRKYENKFWKRFGTELYLRQESVKKSDPCWIDSSIAWYHVVVQCVRKFAQNFSVRRVLKNRLIRKLQKNRLILLITTHTPEPIFWTNDPRISHFLLTSICSKEDVWKRRVI